MEATLRRRLYGGDFTGATYWATLRGRLNEKGDTLKATLQGDFTGDLMEAIYLELLYGGDLFGGLRRRVNGGDLLG